MGEKMDDKEVEFEFDDNKRGIRLRIKATKAIVDAYLKEYAPNLQDSFTREAPVLENSALVPQSVSASELPERPQVNRLTDYVEAIMLSPWGVKGRTSTEIISVAQAHGVPVTMSSLSGILYGLVQNGKLRRTRGEGDALWRYSPPLSYSLNNQPK